VKSKILAIIEILLVYAVMQTLGIALRSIGIVQWEVQNLGWTYIGMFIFVCIPALVIFLTRRNWAEYGVTLADWKTSLDLGIKAYLVRIIPVAVLMLTILWLKMDHRTFPGGAITSLGEIVGIAIMLVILGRQKPTKALSAARSNVVTIILLFLFPIVLAWMLGKLTLIIFSTVVWQFFFSGFGEEFVWRGYVQSRLNRAFGRPLRMFGIQFGAGLIITSILFGFFHAFNTYDPAIGFASLSWGWALSATFGGLLFGILREKTGNLLACGLAHGLPDAVGEALAKIFSWM
jgi:membrane protease YdiL (CAAX protease family)